METPTPAMEGGKLSYGEEGRTFMPLLLLTFVSDGVLEAFPTASAGDEVRTELRRGTTGRRPVGGLGNEEAVCCVRCWCWDD
jgi:hypothetical protein